MSAGESNNEGKAASFLSYIKEFISGQFFIREVPSYANSFWYSLGFLNIVCFSILMLTGLVMVAFGPLWWEANVLGVFFRSIHLWAADAFLLFIILHAFVVFSTSGYKKPRRFIWLVGSIMLFIVAIQMEFGFGLRGDFGSQWRSLSAADFWNGIGLGGLFNPLNYSQLYGIHIALIPIVLIALIIVHFSLVKMKGLSTPYRKEVKYEMVKADHKMLFVRGIAVTALIIILALLFPSPFVAPITIQKLARTNATMVATTLVSEFNHSSGTATYFDSIDPYKFDTRAIYVAKPYVQYLEISHGANMLDAFNSENSSMQERNIRTAQIYFADNGTPNTNSSSTNPVIPVVSSLVIMAQSGLYQGALLNGTSQYGDQTYVLRFLSDTGYMNAQASQLGMSLSQYGMVKDDNGMPTSWLLAPVNFIDNTVLANDAHQDRDNGLILGIISLFVIAIPVGPFIKDLPDKLGLYKPFWRPKK